MPRKKVSTTVYLTEEQVIALKELHLRTRVPVAEYIRLGIDLILAQHREKLPGQVSLFEEISNEALGWGYKDTVKEELIEALQKAQKPENPAKGQE